MNNLTNEASQKCLLCGARFATDEKCRDRFDLCLALEFENPSTFGVVHHLTVSCYMLQHNEYSRDFWLEARKMIALFMQNNITPTGLRKQNRSKLDSGNRTWSITKGEKLLEFESILWSRNISDIRLDNAEVYCSDIKLWASAILKDTEALRQKPNIPDHQ